MTDMNEIDMQLCRIVSYVSTLLSGQLSLARHRETIPSAVEAAQVSNTGRIFSITAL